VLVAAGRGLSPAPPGDIAFSIKHLGLACAHHLLPAAAAVAIALPAVPANAAGNASADLQAMRELNLIVLDNLNAGHETEGKALIGGSVTGRNSNFGIGNAAQGAAVSNRRPLTVGGNFSGGNINLSNGQTVSVGGNITGNVSDNNNSQTMRAVGSINCNANGAVFVANLGTGWNAASTSRAVAAERAQLVDDLAAL
jgi:hypothetical protein